MRFVGFHTGGREAWIGQVRRLQVGLRSRTGRWRMSLFVWIVLGLLAGFVASHLVNHRGEGMVLDVLLGIVGAIVGGWLWHYFGREGVNGLNVHSLFVAT